MNIPKVFSEFCNKQNHHVQISYNIDPVFFKFKDDGNGKVDDNSAAKHKEKDECPSCGKKFRRLLQHIKMNKKCNFYF